MTDSANQSATTDRAALLNQLRIDRSEPPPSGGSAKWWATAFAVILIGASAIWYLMRPTGVPITTAVAQSVAAGGSAAAGGTSLLDASGYIVARRRATVSSKVTGKVVKVMLEEGQRVEAGQVIALLDDANWRATLAQSKAQLDQAEANVASTQTAFDDAKPIFERAEKQKAAAVISAQSFDESRAQFDVTHHNLLIAQRGLEAARAGVEVAQHNLEDTVIRAPFAGVVTGKRRRPARSCRRCPRAAASRARASAPSSTWIRSKSKSTSARTSSIACGRRSRPPSSSMPIRIGRFPRRSSP